MSDATPPQADPTSDVKARNKFFTQVALAGSKELRGYLPLDETHYLRRTLEAQDNARAYFMYSTLDTVYEAGIAMMRWEELLAGDEKEQVADDSIEGRLINEALSAEGAMWTRRLIEALTTLICFSSTNEETYYRHWLFVDQLDSFSYARRDQVDYFACESKGLARWIADTMAAIRAMEPQVDFPRCWYLKGKHALPAAPRPGLLASFGSKLRAAMPLAKPREKAELGLSYHQFSRVSGSIHFSPGDKWYERDDGGLASHFSHCSLLVQSSLLRVIELNDMKPTGLCAQLMKVYDTNVAADENSRRMTSGRAKVGDFVVVGRGLARVVSIKTGPYGYESYAIKYLEDPPAPDLAEDEVLPFHVRRLQEAAAIKERAFQLMKQVAPDSKVSDDERRQHIEESIEESVREVWNRGLREYVLSRAAVNRPG